jgi:hypothetical protein
MKNLKEKIVFIIADMSMLLAGGAVPNESTTVQKELEKIHHLACLVNNSSPENLEKDLLTLLSSDLFHEVGDNYISYFKKDNYDTIKLPCEIVIESH